MKNSLSRVQCVSGFALKLIALITMTIDHVTCVLSEIVPFFKENYFILRGIGRIAFPIYCFLLVEGYFHTHSVSRYMGRLLFAFVLSELPFDLVFSGTAWDWSYQNVMLTLAIGLLSVTLVDHAAFYANKIAHSKRTQNVLQSLMILLFGAFGYLLAELCATDYGGGGVVIILLFYLFRKHPAWLCLSVFIAMYALFWWFEAIGIIAMVPILLYNGKKGPCPGGKAGQWFFYLYYPLHLAVLSAVLIL